MGDMNTPPIQIFRPGRHTASSGQTLSFTAADLKATAEAYDPVRHQAPLVVGHPALDAPAYGWVASLQFQEPGGVLEALPEQVDPAFAELVKAGRFKRISASFYRPEAPGNPAPGTYYLRHVGFLGAAAPAVQGLRPVQFSADDSGTLTCEFSAQERWGWRTLAGLFRRLREKTLVSDGPEVADEIYPEWDLQALADAAEEPPENPAPIAYQESDLATDLHFAEREQALAAQTQALAAQKAELDAREAKLAAEAAERQRSECAAFAEGLVREGRLLPRDQAGVVALLACLPGEPSADFAEGEAEPPRSPSAYLRDLLSRAPVLVDFSERSAPQPSAAVRAEFAAPDGWQPDPAGLALHRKALDYQAAHPNTPYAVAVAAVAKEHRA